jgi:hypothetical protein
MLAYVTFESLLSSLDGRTILRALRHRKICTLFDQIANFIVFSPTIIYNVIKLDVDSTSSQWTRFSI